jgi:pimeloyl-ACP methyl ester carboxylesterase
MDHRNFQLDTEWNIVHYPEQPTGFGILIIGDERNYVEKEGDFWTQNEGKKRFISHLKNEGYTIFYSNLYRKNWGSNRATKLAKQLYDYMMRTEILNGKVHLFAEGMGALVAIKLMAECKNQIRSVVLVNPVISLKKQLSHEKEDKFFYKKLLKEIAVAYGLAVNEVEGFVVKNDEPTLPAGIPIKIIHILSGKRSYKLSLVLKELMLMWEKDEKTVSICYMLPEKSSQLASKTTRFFKQHEKNL